MTVDAEEPAIHDELVHERLVPVPVPREPAPELVLFGHDGGANTCMQKLLQGVMEVYTAITRRRSPATDVPTRIVRTWRHVCSRRSVR